MTIPFILQDAFPRQVPHFLYRIYCIQQEVPLPYATAPRRPEESQQAERQGKYPPEAHIIYSLCFSKKTEPNINKCEVTNLPFRLWPLLCLLSLQLWETSI